MYRKLRFRRASSTPSDPNDSGSPPGTGTDKDDPSATSSGRSSSTPPTTSTSSTISHASSSQEITPATPTTTSSGTVTGSPISSTTTSITTTSTSSSVALSSISPGTSPRDTPGTTPSTSTSTSTTTSPSSNTPTVAPPTPEEPSSTLVSTDSPINIPTIKNSQTITSTIPTTSQIDTPTKSDTLPTTQTVVTTSTPASEPKPPVSSPETPILHLPSPSSILHVITSLVHIPPLQSAGTTTTPLSQSVGTPTTSPAGESPPTITNSSKSNSPRPTETTSPVVEPAPTPQVQPTQPGPQSSGTSIAVVPTISTTIQTINAVVSTPAISSANVLDVDLNNVDGRSSLTNTVTSNILNPSPSLEEQSVGAASLTTELVATTFLTTGVSTIVTTSALPSGGFTVITSRSTFTRLTTSTSSIVTTRPTVPARVNAKNNAATVAGGVVSGVLGLLLILAAAFCFLRIRRRRTRNVVDVVYSPIEPSGSPSDVEGQTRQLPPIRTITPLAWPIDLSRPPHLPETSARDADNAGPSRPVEIVSNPFEPVAFTSSSHKLVDVASVKSSRSLHSDDGNPFEDGANQYWSRDSGDSSLDAAYPESEMLHIDGGLGRSSSTTVTEQRAQIDHEQKAQVDHARHLSMTSDCPYPVLEPDSQERPRHLSVKSMKSGLSYATLDPDWVKRMQDQHLSRTSSASTSSSVVNMGYAI